MNTEKILIIEDEELIREELKTLLSNAGYVVDCVVDFGETLNYIKLTSPDLILLDVNLPGQDGYILCTSIRSFAAIPILFITGRNTAMDELQALTLGGDDYIAKPYNVPILLARINLLLHRGRGEQNYMIEYKGIQLNPIAGTLTLHDKEIELTNIAGIGEVSIEKEIFEIEKRQHKWMTEYEYKHHFFRSFVVGQENEAIQTVIDICNDRDLFWDLEEVW